MKNVMNYRGLNTFAALLVTAAMYGCQDKIHGENFEPEGSPTSIGRINQAQSATGAKDDAMLYDMHFHGDQLTSLGQGKLDLIVKATPDTDPVKIYMNMPHDQATERQLAVTEYLKTAGIADGRIVVAEGINPNATHPTAYQMSKLYMKEGTAFSGQSPDDSASGGGGPLPGSH